MFAYRFAAVPAGSFSRQQWIRPARRVESMYWSRRSVIEPGPEPMIVGNASFHALNSATPPGHWLFVAMVAAEAVVIPHPIAPLNPEVADARNPLRRIDWTGGDSPSLTVAVRYVREKASMLSAVDGEPDTVRPTRPTKNCQVFAFAGRRIACHQTFRLAAIGQEAIVIVRVVVEVFWRNWQRIDEVVGQSILNNTAPLVLMKSATRRFVTDEL
jgi:hypothetical protein